MINDISLKNFRSYKNFKINFSSKINLFIGNNGEGKTNLLEAIYFVILLRSFRTSSLKDLMKIGSDGFYLSSNIDAGKGWTQFLEIDYRKERTLRIDNLPIRKASEFIGKINIVAFAPNDIMIITDRSFFRRRFINMILSSMFPQYLITLNEYNRALKSRNSLLKIDNSRREIEAFDHILARCGSFIANKRLSFFNKLTDEMLLLLTSIRDDIEQFKIKYTAHSATFNEDSYLEKLKIDRDKDILRGYSTFGPHIDDFDFLMNAKSLRHFGSTGQCRITSLCLKMATVTIIDKESSVSQKIVTLIDDVTGDLDKKTRDAFFTVINKSDQTFFTFTEKPEDLFFQEAEIFNI